MSDIFHLLISPLNWEPLNKYDMSVTLDTSHLLMSPLNLELSNIRDISVTLETSHLLMSPLNLEPLNIHAILVTLETFHLLMSPLNGDQLNKSDMSVTCDTSIKFKSQFGPSFSTVSLMSCSRCSRSRAITFSDIFFPFAYEQRKIFIIFFIYTLFG